MFENIPYGMYCIKDIVTGRFCQPLLFVNDGDAKRYFLEIMKDCPNRGDYQLYRIGEYNTLSGETVSKVEFINVEVDNG